MTDRPRHTAALVPDPPRVIPRWFYWRRARAMMFCGLLFAGLGIGLGVGLPAFFYVLGGSVWPTVDWDLDRSHALATAVITDKQFMTHTHVNSRHPWRVAFRFTTPAGASVEAVGHTYDQSFADKAVGESIEVEYDPADPSRARPVGGTAALLPGWVFLLILALLCPELIVGVVLLSLAAVRARSERILLMYGAGTVAEVVQVRRVGYINMGRHSPYDIYYRFTDHSGLEVAGKDRTYHYAWAEALRPQENVGAVYNPHSPAANVLWLHGGDVESGTSNA